MAEQTIQMAIHEFREWTISHGKTTARNTGPGDLDPAPYQMITVPMSEAIEAFVSDNPDFAILRAELVQNLPANVRLGKTHWENRS